ncbi:MAG: hypothetical protein A4E66_02735 [Syntrophus sp. PtaB.Bin001]|nr:MAG: hypothetical protein A4E66_02735 [Syntrophus sp. PtaB.Bin001]
MWFQKIGQLLPDLFPLQGSDHQSDNFQTTALRFRKSENKCIFHFIDFLELFTNFSQVDPFAGYLDNIVGTAQ